jgi:hypothetical protein
MILSLIGALYGLFCIGLPFAVAGIVCGHIAISKIRSKSLKGRGFALTGLIAGYIVVLLSFLVGAVLVIGVCAAAASDSAEYYSEPVSLEDIDGVGELPLKTEAVE